MRKIYKILATLFAFLFVSALLLQIDDDLLPEVQALLDEGQPPVESEAYYYLVGIGAAADQSPGTAGREVFNAFVKAENKRLANGDHYELPETFGKSDLPLPEGTLKCDLETKECAELLFSESSDLAAFLQSNHILLERYNEYSGLNDYATLSSPSLFGPYLPFNYIATAGRLKLLASIKEAKTFDSVHGMRLIIENISSLRRQLALQDNLIGKMVYLKLISESIDYAYLISSRLREKTAIHLLSLDTKEKDFKKVMAREFIITSDVIFNMFDTKEGRKWPVWLQKIIFKPNMMINASLPFYEESIKRSALSHLEFAAKISRNHEPKIHNSWIRNPYGSTLNMMYAGMRAYDTYRMRMLDLDAKIILFNAAVKASNAESLVGSLSSPYFESGHAAYLSEDGRKICFDGPLPMHRDFRCLRIKM